MADNFIVDTPNRELTETVIRQADHHRAVIARRWAGRELEDWESPCLVFVALEDKPWGYMYHAQGNIRGIIARGPYGEVLTRTLPHEIAHTVMYTYFGDNLPLWADEGVAVSSELDCPLRLNGWFGRQPLHELFKVNTYPYDWELFYGQGYSVTKYIADEYGEEQFMDFVRFGSMFGWQEACRMHLGKSLSSLDKDWQIWHDGKFTAKPTTPRDAGIPLWCDGPGARRWRRMEEASNAPPQPSWRHRYGPLLETIRRCSRRWSGKGKATGGESGRRP